METIPFTPLLANALSSLVPDGPEHRATPQRPDAVLVAADVHEFDVIATTDYRVQAFDGIGSMRIELDFVVA